MAAKGNKPALIARASQDEDSDYMHTLGAAWRFKNGEGFVVKLQTLPVNFDGTFILVPAKED